ncbi:(2Fe-2S)-binding protein [Limimaricola pyoseonensis]|uniref:Nicotinate dehydrogenase subunit A n=1 Tax=Limimaricola pyoseonensis TaxID=521013 RepID=A0A1G7JIQ0_9RHOB|nr:(2Fe-2S)-binding protein [Limimaricola pyoseonensis]SDF24369.1 nicotinate dehydrogenase subunit A [Limimaricola pyoseonensis]
MTGPVATTITTTINGAEHRIDRADGRMLLDVLRDDLGLTGAKYGCGMAQCGACTVLVDGRPARACVLRTGRVAGRNITTLEGLAEPDGRLHPVQQAFLECEGAQCGYCLNGMVMTTLALLADTPAPTEAEIRDALRHNLCRCGTHTEIIASARRAAELMGDRNA